MEETKCMSSHRMRSWPIMKASLLSQAQFGFDICCWQNAVKSVCSLWHYSGTPLGCPTCPPSSTTPGKSWVPLHFLGSAAPSLWLAAWQDGNCSIEQPTAASNLFTGPLLVLLSVLLTRPRPRQCEVPPSPMQPGHSSVRGVIP